MSGLNENPWTSPVIVLVAGLVLIALFNVDDSMLSGTREVAGSRDLAQLVRVDAAAMHKDFVCTCCGKSIAECTCGMAAARRAMVDELAAKDLSKKEIYKEMVKKYTTEILFNEALAAEVRQELVAEAPMDRPIVSISPKIVDVGQVSMAKGEVETMYKVSNMGKEDLEISGLETSCMCTSAFLQKNGEEGPVFGMHDNPTGWSLTLEPGEEAQLVVVFDPNAHGPEATGAVTREITVFSNDVIDSAKKVQFAADVVK